MIARETVYRQPPEIKNKRIPGWNDEMKLSLSVNRLCSGILYGYLQVNP